MTTNPIAIGFDWRQAFDFPAGFFEESDVVRAEFRVYASERLALVEVGAGQGTLIDGNRLHVSLTEAQTTLMKPGKVVTNFVVERVEKEFARIGNIPIGVIVIVPVVLLPTRPRACSSPSSTRRSRRRLSRFSRPTAFPCR